MKKRFNDSSELPMTLSGEDLAAALNISRAGAYNLMNSDGFPKIRIGKRIMVLKSDFLIWVENNAKINTSIEGVQLCQE